MIENLIEPLTEDQRQLLRQAAEAAIAAVDEAREANAKANIAKSTLKDLMDTFGARQVEALGRTISFTVENKTKLTLTALKEVLGPKLADSVWKNLPREPSRRLDIPGCADDGPI